VRERREERAAGLLQEKKEVLNASLGKKKDAVTAGGKKGTFLFHPRGKRKGEKGSRAGTLGKGLQENRNKREPPFCGPGKKKKREEKTSSREKKKKGGGLPP